MCFSTAGNRPNRLKQKGCETYLLARGTKIFALGRSKFQLLDFLSHKQTSSVVSPKLQGPKLCCRGLRSAAMTNGADQRW